MSHYILLERIKVENANAIAGITYGFPAITQFLGFTHALSRKLNEDGLAFDGCGVFCHEHKVDIYKRYRDFYFVQKKTSPSALLSNRSKAHETPPIIEEGKMDMTVSILLRCTADLGLESLHKEYKQKIEQLLFQLRLAGGSIFSYQGMHFYSEGSDLNRIKRRLLPSFVLMDASKQLKQHIEDVPANNDQQELFDLWADFFAYRAKVVDDLEEIDDPTDLVQEKRHKSQKVVWQQLDKPQKGWFVPLMIGYKGISPLHDVNKVANLRDQRYPFRFVESVHSIGEWLGVHRINSLEETIWQYQVEDEWYLCSQEKVQRNIATESEDITQLVDNFFSSI